MKGLDKGMRWAFEQNKITVECFEAGYCFHYIARNSIAIDESNSVPAGNFEIRTLRQIFYVGTE
jgi:hypothetical protein